MSTPNDSNGNLIISYLSLRKYLGYAGIALPFVLIIGALIYSKCEPGQGSISAYYHTPMRNIFVAIVCAIAIFLGSYNVEDKQERILCKFASLFAFGVAFFPTAIDDNYLITKSTSLSLADFQGCIIPSALSNKMIGNIHLFSAAMFFVLLSILVITRFAKTEKTRRSKLKNRRVFWYNTCGFIMILSIILIAIYWLFLDDKYPILDTFLLKPVFILESFALIAFGIAWLIKGEIIYKEHIS